MSKIGIGPTKILRLRVSVAALAGVLFEHPRDGRTMLALEHTATLQNNDSQPVIKIRAKAFGGAVRLTDGQALAGLIGTFHYDSEQSRRENDFRLVIHPSSWEKVKQICREHLNNPQKKIVETSPVRELTEELNDILQTEVTQDQYILQARGMAVQDQPLATHNRRAAGLPTVRFYFLFEARVLSPKLVTMILDNNRRCSVEVLREQAWQDARQGGKGRANAILTLELAGLKQFYRSLPESQTGASRQYGRHQLDANVQALII